jgi:patatin-related protein
MTTAAKPDIDCTKEVRFAIVMYGGVSLAIYINGVAQEFFRLVRATAKDANGNQALLCDTTTSGTAQTKDQLVGTERVYRKLSYLLSDTALLEEYRNFLKLKSAPENLTPLAEAAVDGERDIAKKLDQILAENNKPIKTRFVVDILSGTSAGGINGIHLAKALANNQNIDQLKQLWINEGDISLLLNDKGSVGGLGIANQSPPQSLLNSRRMYLKLLKSLEDMDKDDDSVSSNYVDELDLFITATDIEGVPVPIRLSDTVVRERRHRTVFHFQYSTAEASGRSSNDFIARNNPFLAYAARCTSSFPFAFEPMRLCDIDEVLDTFPAYSKEDYPKLKEEWTRFFRDYIDPGHEQDKMSYLNRSFGDGGYLDNKPFTYSTDTLASRHAPVQVDRKLVYIEPSPEHPEDDPLREGTYDALQNVKAALLDLPSYETIREDLQRVVSRNDLINRVNRISAAIEKDLDQSNWIRPKLEPGEWRTFDLAAMVKKFGIYYLPYRRLRISSATEELAKLVARCLNLDTRSATFFAIRSLVRGWRELNYPDYHKPAADAAPSAKNAGNDRGAAQGMTANQFLEDFDFKYWIRRLLFISKKIDQTLNLLQMLPNGPDGNGLDSNTLTDAQRSIVKRLKDLEFHSLDYAKLSATEKREVLDVLVYLKCEVSEVYKKLRIAGRNLEPSGKDGNDFAAKIRQIKLDKDRLDFLLGMPGASQSDQPEFSKLDEDQCARRAQDLLLGHAFSPVAGTPTLADGFQLAATALKKVIKATVLDPTWNRCQALFKADHPLPEASGACAHRWPESKHADSIRSYLWRYFSQFDDFDQISFPILFGTDVGESDVVEIIRISPEDAVTLVNERQERKNSADGIGRQKLAGTSLRHFGAFLDRTWRQNDIMWGRLDGAERIITSLLPEPEDQHVRAALIKEAHTAILIQEIPPENRVALGRLMSDALMRASAGEPIQTAISKVIADMDAESPIKRRLQTVMCNSLADDELLKFIATSYEVNRKLDPKSMLRVISRSTQIVGNLFEDLATKNSLDGNNLAWIARLGQVFWGLVEVAVPNSLLNLLVFHWLRLLYVFEIILILGATLLAAPDTLKFAWTALGITAAVNITVLLLRDRMRLKKGWLVFAVSVFTFALLGLAAWGARDLWQARTGIVQTIRSWVL